MCIRDRSDAIRDNLGPAAPDDSLIKFHLALHAGSAFLVNTPLSGDNTIAASILTHIMGSGPRSILIDDFIKTKLQRSQLNCALLSPALKDIRQEVESSGGRIEMGLLFLIMIPYRNQYIESTKPATSDYVTNMMIGVQNFLGCLIDHTEGVLSRDPDTATKWQMLSVNVGKEFESFVAVISDQLENALRGRT